MTAVRHISTHLHEAISSGRLTHVHQLLQDGADPNDASSDYGMRPLGVALSSRARVPTDDLLKITAMLMEFGADPHLIDPRDNTNAITYASLIGDSSRFLEIMFTTGRHRGNPNLTDHNGLLPLQMANGQAEAKTLIKFGADIFKPCYDGQSALETYRLERPEWVPMLLMEALVRPHMCNGRININFLVDSRGNPTRMMIQLLQNTVPEALIDPALFERPQDLYRLFPLLPPALQGRIDMSGYRNHKLESYPQDAEAEGFIKRYRRSPPEKIPNER